jgi:hypothetical protein
VDPLILLAVALVIFSAWARLLASGKARTMSSIDDLITKLYEAAKGYGDPIHVSLGIYVAKLFYMGTPTTLVVAAVLSAIYVVYQVVEHDSSAPKDLAVYVASLAVAFSYYSGIPIPFKL